MSSINGKLRILGFILMVVVLLTVLPGCSGESTTATVTTTGPTITATATATATITATPTTTLSPTPNDVPPLTAVKRFRVATTTSLYDTGLWGYLEPMLEEQYNVELDVLSTGSGQALEYGRRGDVDALTVHDKPNELIFISDNYGVERVPFAYNYFLIVGPESDPAGIKGMTPENALKTLFETQAGTFASRGDNSGTHSMEKRIWALAGYEYEQVEAAGDWYLEAGSSMGATLQLADQKAGYTLTDMGTYIAYKTKLSLVPIVDKGDILLNVYSVIAINPQKVTTAKNLAMADNLISFLTSPDIQELIGKYGVEEYGLQLFIPCAGNEPGT